MLSKFVKESESFINKRKICHVISIVRAKIYLRNMLKSLNFNVSFYVR